MALIVFPFHLKLLFIVVCNSSQAFLYRSSHRRCSVKKSVLRNFAKFTCQSLFFNVGAGLRPTTLLKKSLWHRYFSVNLAKFLRTPFLQNDSGRLLLSLRYVEWSRIFRVLISVGSFYTNVTPKQDASASYMDQWNLLFTLEQNDSENLKNHKNYLPY